MKEEDKESSALNVNPGVNQPEAVNSEAVRLFKEKKRKKRSTREYFDGICQGDRSNAQSGDNPY